MPSRTSTTTHSGRGFLDRASHQSTPACTACAAVALTAAPTKGARPLMCPAHRQDAEAKEATKEATTSSFAGCLCEKDVRAYEHTRDKRKRKGEVLKRKAAKRDRQCGHCLALAQRAVRRRHMAAMDVAYDASELLDFNLPFRPSDYHRVHPTPTHDRQFRLADFIPHFKKDAKPRKPQGKSHISLPLVR
jgi:hypothetical protein